MAEHICDGQWRYYCEECSGLPEAGEIPMTDQDNLRDRIKRLVDETDDGDSAAQAIIDEFGLTVETMTLGGMREAGAPFTTTRIVGKWEH